MKPRHPWIIIPTDAETRIFQDYLVKSLWPSDAIWRHRSWSTLAQVMACCLTAPSHYLNQCWLIVSTDQWRLSKGHFTRDTPVINHKNQLQFALKNSSKSPRGQWVNTYPLMPWFRVAWWSATMVFCVVHVAQHVAPWVYIKVTWMYYWWLCYVCYRALWNLININWGNGLSPVRCQAITWPNADSSTITPLREWFWKMWIKIQIFS